MGSSSSITADQTFSDDAGDKALGKLAKDHKVAEAMTDKDSRSVTATAQHLADKSK